MESPSTTEFEPLLYDMFDLDVARRVVVNIARITNDGIVLKSSDGSVVWHNAVACRHLRVTSSELLGTTSFDPTWKWIRLDGSPYPGDDHPGMRTLRTGVPIGDDVMGLRAGDDGELRWLSVATTPIEIEGDRYVIIVFNDITRELENSRALRSTLDTMQARLVPDQIPTIDGIHVAAAYRGVGVADSLGGDFYGSHVDGPDDLSFFIGDVCGHGVGSAGVSSLAHASLRALGPFVDDPEEMLTLIHDVVFEDSPAAVLSLIHGRLRRDGGRTVLSVANGGHPLPILVRDGHTSEIGSSGGLLGLFENTRRPTTECELYPGDRVVMYTEGVTDGIRPRLNTTDLLDRIPTTGSIDRIVDMLGRLVEAFRDDEADDAAILGFEVQ